MKKLLLTGLLLSFIIFIASSFGQKTVKHGESDQIVILVSLDGYRADYLDRFPSPNLSYLVEQGVHARALISSFPTKTFPNHYTLVTGLYPANHGIVANVIYDPIFDETFNMSKREEVQNARWWGGEPLWVTAEKQGVPAATYFWPGSEAPVQGIRPSFWKQYDGSVPGKDRVDEVLSWLDLSGDQRPRFITLYFSNVDSRGHRFGPDSKEVEEGIQMVDAHLGRLMKGIEDRELDEMVNLIVVSDHGMAETDPEKLIFLDDYIDLNAVQLVDISPVAMLNGLDGNAETIYQALHEVHPALDVYLKKDYPVDWHWTGNRRITEIAAVAEEGWTIIDSRANFESGGGGIFPGAHGYDRRLDSMGGLFVAQGPSFADGKLVDAFENIHIYPLIAHILALKPAETDGSLQEVRHLLK